MITKKYCYKLTIKPIFSLEGKSITIYHHSNINLFDAKNKKLSKKRLKDLKFKFDKEVKEACEDPFFNITGYSYKDGTRNNL